MCGNPLISHAGAGGIDFPPAPTLYRRSPELAAARQARFALVALLAQRQLTPEEEKEYDRVIAQIAELTRQIRKEA